MTWLFKLLYIIFAYLLGSILFSELSVKLLCKKSLMEISANHNPGASNAFKYGGTFCGILSVIGDVGKGALAVFLYRLLFKDSDIPLTCVMIAVALGHAFSIYHHFQGGMCIAVSFGVLLGLLPQFYPILLLICFYLVLLFLHKHSNSATTIYVFFCLSVVSLVLCIMGLIDPYQTFGIFLVSLLVCIRIWPDIDTEEQESLRVFVNREQQ